MNKIRLPHDGAEYVHFRFSPTVLPSGTVLEAQISGAWYPIEQPAGELPRLLVRGPDSTSTLGVLVTDDSPIRVRVKSTPESIVRGAGYITLVK